MPVVHGLPVPVLSGQVTPRAPRPGAEEDPVDHRAVVVPPVPLPRVSRQQRLQPRPLLITQIMPIQPIISHSTISAETATKIYETRPRRLRSALATYRPLLDRKRTDPVRDELKW